MVARLPAASCVQVNVHQSLGDDLNVENVFHYQCTAAGPFTATQLNDIAIGFYTNWNGDVMPHLSVALDLNAVTTRDISVDLGGDGADGLNESNPGAVGGVVLPANVALVTSWREFESYRGGHPRTYLSGIPSAEQADPQHVTLAYGQAVQTAMTAFLGHINTQAGWPAGSPAGKLVVVHYTRHNAVLVPPNVFNILSCAVNTRIDSQRRRLES